MSDRHADVIWHWIRNGPRDGCGLLEFFLGSMFWWRMQAVAACTAIPFLLGAIAYSYISPTAGLWAAWLAGLYGGGYTIKVSPKYNVTKNY